MTAFGNRGKLTASSPADFDGKLKRLHHTLQAMTGWQPKAGDW